MSGYLPRLGLILAAAGVAVGTIAPAAPVRTPRQASSTLARQYDVWLNADVAYLITPDERKAFLALDSDAARDAYIDGFWKKRDPDPATPYNAYKEEHFRRMEFANQHYTVGSVPGWKTDRGHIYILWGKPNDIVDKDPALSGKKAQAGLAPYEDWIYSCLQGIGQNIVVKFTDSCRCNDYEMSPDAEHKDQLFAPPPLLGHPAGGCASPSDVSRGPAPVNGYIPAGNAGDLLPPRMR